MPAQWPTFINTVSSKLISRTLSSDRNAEQEVKQYTLEIAELFADEYYKAVKTAQTPFGNIHQPGTKSILTVGFKKSFGKLFESINPQLEDKFTDPLYADINEGLPIPDYSYDPLCEIEEWSLENKDRLKKFQFYPIFPSTCPIKDNTQSEITIENTTPIDINAATEEAEQNAVYVTMSISGFDKSLSYLFRYSINGEMQDDISPEENGSIKLLVPQTPGDYTWKFEQVIHGSTGDIIKNIIKSKSVSISKTGEVTIPQESDDAYVKPLRDLVPEMTNKEKLNYTVHHVLSQNDGSETYKKWVDNMTRYLYANTSLIRSVQNEVQKLAEQERERLEKIRKDRIAEVSSNVKRSIGNEKKRLKKLEKNLRGKDINLTASEKKIIPESTKNSIEYTANEYIFQENRTDKKDQLPDFMSASFISALTYIESIDKRFNLTNSSSINFYHASTHKARAYTAEKNKWHDLLRQWANEQKDANSIDEDIADEKDPYDIMAETIITYWKATGPMPFKAPPPIPPCNIPSPGTFIPVYYGNEKRLANDLRRAWNMGKRTSTQPGLQPASQVVAAAVAAACAKHLLELKFIYVGQLFVGTGAVPMIGFSPMAF